VVNPALPSEGALKEVRRLAGSSATIESVVSLEGGQHAATWRVDTATPARTVVVRQFPAGDSAADHEAQVLRVLNGLGGLAPMLLGSDLAGGWSKCPTVLISWLDGEADITPSDPDAWAAQLGRALARVHAMPSERLSALPSVFDGSGVAHAFWVAFVSEPVEGKERIDLLLDDLAQSHGGLVELRARAGERRVAPGESRDVELTLRFSDRLRPGHAYAGSWDAEGLHLRIRVSVPAAKGKPRAAEAVR